MHYYQSGIGGYGLYLGFNSVSWIFVSLMFFIVCLKVAKAKYFMFCKTDIYLLIVFSVCMLPLLWSPSPWRESSYDRYIGMIAILLIILAHRQIIFSSKQKKIFFAFISGAVFIQSLVGLAQFTFPEQFSFTASNRPIGTLLQPNVYASLLATGLAVSLTQLFYSDLSKILKTFHYLVIFSVVLLQVLVISRVGMLGSLIVIVMMFALSWGDRKQVIKVVMVILMAVIFGSLLKFVVVGGDKARNIDELSNLGYRSIAYSLSIDLIKNKPLKGYGLGRFSSIYMDRQSEFLIDKPNLIKSTGPLTHPHNELLLWWVEAGLLPVLAMVLFGIWFAQLVWRNGAFHHKTAFICMLPILLHTQTEYPFYQSTPHLIIFALLLSEATPEKLRAINHSLDFLFKALGSLAIILTSIFMLSNLHTSWLLYKYSVFKDQKYLLKIMNPLAQQEVVLIHKVEVLLAENTTESLNVAEYIASSQSVLNPSEGAFWLLYRAQYKNKKIADATLTKIRGRALFPASRLFMP
jgi:O-antigen polymerase